MEGIGFVTQGQLANVQNDLIARIQSAASGVTSFNARNGAVVLLAADVTGVGGALLASPTFTGTPSAPTAAPGTNTTQLASTAYVTAAVAAFVPSGVIKPDGSVNYSAAQPFFAGTVALPGIAFVGQLDMGVYKISATQMGLAVGGALQAVVNTTGLQTGHISELVGAAGIVFTGTGFADFTGMGAATDFGTLGIKANNVKASGANSNLVIGLPTNSTGSIGILDSPVGQGGISIIGNGGVTISNGGVAGMPINILALGAGSTITAGTDAGTIVLEPVVGFVASTVSAPIKGTLSDASSLGDVLKWCQGIENALFGSIGLLHT